VTLAKGRLVILGASGMLGQSMRQEYFRSDWSVTTVGGSRATECDFGVDAVDGFRLRALLNDLQPDAVLNLTGLTSVDYCEQHPREAYQINTKIAENLMGWRDEKSPGCYVLHLSTDHVYHGDGPHSEDQAEPSNYYALTKYAGELVVVRANAACVRTNFFGVSGLANRKSFSDWLYESLSKGQQLDVYSDVKFSPLSMPTLSSFLQRLLQLRPQGIYNLGSRSGLSKADFAFQFAEQVGLGTSNLTVKPSPEPDSRRAYRPKDMRMAVSKIEAILGESMPELVDEIQKVRPEYLP